jgi:hypothetical protein
MRGIHFIAIAFLALGSACGDDDPPPSANPGTAGSGAATGGSGGRSGTGGATGGAAGDDGQDGDASTPDASDDVGADDAFSDTPGDGPPCGMISCGPNEYCCDATCGLCAEMGTPCLQCPGDSGADGG